MKISGELFERASNAAFDHANTGGEALMTDRALLAFLAAMGIRVEPDPASLPPSGLCLCRPDVQENCNVPGCRGGKDVAYWILRTWVDVRRGDVVRMPGQEATASEVVELTTLNWHVNDIPPKGSTPEQAEQFARDVQYRPNEHAGEWTARPVTLRPLGAGDPGARHRIPNVNPAAPVEIRLTQAEVDAIELLGGWAMRA